MILFIIIALVTALLGIIFWPFIRDLQNPEYRERFTAWVARQGFLGVLVLFGVQMLQIVVAVIPGGPVQLIAGAAYGTWKGLLIIMTGCAAATTLVFFLVRKFGLPLVRRFFGDEEIKAWDFFRDEKRTALVTFILFLIPGTPKDMLTYLAPLSRLSQLHFTVIALLARFPAVLSSAAMGDAALRGKPVLFYVVFGLTALIGILGIQFKNRIIDRIRKNKE